MEKVSWWCALNREQFAAAVQVEAVRMMNDKKAKHVSVSPHQFRDPPRKRPNTEYGYALEADIIEAV